jgi:carboxypeptidase family protein
MTGRRDETKGRPRRPGSPGNDHFSCCRANHHGDHLRNDKDETGGVLPGVDIVVTNLETGLTRSTVSDPQGYFVVPGLAPGRYEARASLQGFATGVQSGILCWPLPSRLP